MPDYFLSPNEAVHCTAEASHLNIYVNKDNGFAQAETVARECPHCGAHAQLVPVATPSFEALVTARPRHAGIAYRCAACNEPRFVRAAVRAFLPDRVELAASSSEVERPKERFPFSYLPRAVETLFRETLDCYTAGCFNAFASMCRRTLQATGMEAKTRRRLQETYFDIVEAGGLAGPLAETLRALLFGTEGGPPELDAEHAAVLVEVMKDLLHQHYVRAAKLRAAIEMRRYFAAESASKVTPIDRRRESA